LTSQSKNKAVTPPGQPPRRRGRPLVDDKRRRILDAACKTFGERGFHGTTTPVIAAAAGIGTGTLFHYFDTKEELVNELYRDLKLRLRGTLLDDLPEPDLNDPHSTETWFFEVWRRLASFALREPDAFRFLEMHDHVEYLDAESRQIEISTLAPLMLVGTRMHERAGGGPRTDVVIALMWGAFVGLVKASRLGYLHLDEASLLEAGTTVWRMIAPEAARAARPKRGRS
jgi:AcrR family transcriptional regulator